MVHLILKVDSFQVHNVKSLLEMITACLRCPVNITYISFIIEVLDDKIYFFFFSLFFCSFYHICHFRTIYAVTPVINQSNHAKILHE